MMSLLSPVIQDFNVIYTKLCQESDENLQQSYAECLNCAMSFARWVYWGDEIYKPQYALIWFEIYLILQAQPDFGFSLDSLYYFSHHENS